MKIMNTMHTRGLDDDEYKALKTIVAHLIERRTECDDTKGGVGGIYESAETLSYFVDSEEWFLQSHQIGLWSFLKKEWRTLLLLVSCALLNLLFIEEVIRASVKHYCSQ